MAKKIKIMLGDLRHNTAGRHSIFMPIGIGYIASYLLSRLKDVEVKLYENPEVFLKDFDSWEPDVVGLSNYCWNTELSGTVLRYIKQKNPAVVCVLGGQEFPIERAQCKEYLLKRKEADFYVYQEGEAAFSKLIEKLQKTDIFSLRTEPQEGIMHINPVTKELMEGTAIPRIMDLDEIPSPYLTGIMDKWFDGNYAPSVEMVRGCPFTCGFCRASNPWFTPMAEFSVNRMKEELTYIAERMQKYQNVLLSICDSNFGMTEHDEEIARHIRALQDRFNWPNVFNVTTGKANHERILRIAAILNNKLDVSVSIQTLNPKSLETIKRRNLPMDQYKELHAEIKKRGMDSVAELILPLPEETKDSFFASMKVLFNAGVKRIVPYTTMLLKGTALASDEYRKRYGMKTKFRIIPRQFGEYVGQKCFETEEVCIATNTLSFKEYLECRGFSFIAALISAEQFNFMHDHIKELKVDFYEYLICYLAEIKCNGNRLSQIYSQYLEETEKELWDSPGEITAFFLKPENYQKLMTGELGDNLVRGHTTKIILESSDLSIKLAYSVLKKLIRNGITHDLEESLNAAEKWAIASRNIGRVIQNKAFRENKEIIHLDYDLPSWFNSDKSRPLITYKKAVDYRIAFDADRINNILVDLKRLYGTDLFFGVGKFLINNSSRIFWGKSIALGK